MVMATGIFLVGCFTHERIRRFFRPASPSSSSFAVDLGPEEVVLSAAAGAASSTASSSPSYDRRASLSSSLSAAVVVPGPRLDARGRPCMCATCAPPPPPPPPPPLPCTCGICARLPAAAPYTSAEHIYVNMLGNDPAPPDTSFVGAVNPVVDDDDVVVV